MRALLLVCALLAVTAGFKIETQKTQLVKPAKSGQCGPDESPCPSGCMACGCAPEETWCPSGCCPAGPNWYCCPDDWCAATADDCPYEAKSLKLVKLAKSSQCGPDETPCTSGCCPEPNWFCCPDASYSVSYCAATDADCPFEAKRLHLVKLAKSADQCGPDETNCPVGCCPMGPDWYCCPDHFPICAPTAFDCP